MRRFIAVIICLTLIIISGCSDNRISLSDLTNRPNLYSGSRVTVEGWACGPERDIFRGKPCINTGLIGSRAEITVITARSCHFHDGDKIRVTGTFIPEHWKGPILFPNTVDARNGIVRLISRSD